MAEYITKKIGLRASLYDFRGEKAERIELDKNTGLYKRLSENFNDIMYKVFDCLKDQGDFNKYFNKSYYYYEISKYFKEGELFDKYGHRNEKYEITAQFAFCDGVLHIMFYVSNKE